MPEPVAPVADPEPGARAFGELRARQPRAIHSALAVLEEVARHGAGVTARQISAALGMPRATTYRLLNLLVQDEYLVRTPDLSGFALGRKVVQLAGLVAPAPPPQAARDVLTGLRAQIRGGVHLVRYENGRVHLVDVDPDFPLGDERRITQELGASAIGRLLLAEAGPGPSEGASPGPGPGPDSDGVRMPDAVPAGVPDAVAAEVLLAGYARSFDPVAGYGCLALPIRDPAGRLVAGLCLTAPRQRIEQPGEVLERLRAGARELSRLLA